MNFNILQNINEKNIVLEPYPHIIIDNVFDDNTLQIMKSCFTDQNNKKKHSKDIEFDNNDKLEEVVKYFSSDKFHNILFTIFNKFLKVNVKKKPKFKLRETEQDGNVTFNLRFRNDLPKQQKKMYTMFPKLKLVDNYLLEPHLDNKQEILNCLFYFKNDNDNNEGGDLILYKNKLKKPKFFHKRFLNPSDLIEKKVITYKDNRLVVFYNNIKSIHSISYKDNSEYKRCVLNITYELVKTNKNNDKII